MLLWVAVVVLARYTWPEVEHEVVEGGSDVAVRSLAYVQKVLPELDGEYDGLVVEGVGGDMRRTAAVPGGGYEIMFQILLEPPEGKTFAPPFSSTPTTQAMVFYNSKDQPEGMAVDEYPSFVPDQLEWVCTDTGCA